MEQCPAEAVATVIYPEYGNRERVPIEHMRVAKGGSGESGSGSGEAVAGEGVAAVRLVGLSLSSVGRRNKNEVKTHDSRTACTQAAAAAGVTAAAASAAAAAVASGGSSAGTAATSSSSGASSATKEGDGISSLGLSASMREKIIAARKKRKAMETTQLREVPEALQIKADDSELERKRKKRKVKVIKRHNNLVKKNLVAQKKVSSWQNFQAKATKKKKKSKGMRAVNKDSQFGTRDLTMDKMGEGSKSSKKRYY